jgi:hypothetical protein
MSIGAKIEWVREMLLDELRFGRSSGLDYFCHPGEGKVDFF